MQAAIVLVEGVQLIMAVIGIKTSISKKNKKAIVKRTANAIKACPHNQAAFNAFKAAWEKDKALALLQLLSALTYSLLWDILKSLLQGMSWYDVMKSIAVFTANVAASFTSSGVTIVIKTALAINSAVGFIGEVDKLLQLLS